jgi:hypothetical protein
MAEFVCRGCRRSDGSVVLDLGEQPACDFFPAADDPGPDPTYPLRMWLCSACGLAQLIDDPTVPDEPRGAEPAALTEQARDAVERAATAGWLRSGLRAAEYGSPHGGSWLRLLTSRGLHLADADQPADVVLDCFGMMHSADQAAAVAERTRRVAPGGVLLLQFHSLATIVRLGQWNALRHGHYAYYSLGALRSLLADVGFVLQQAWQFDLYGGTVLVAATRKTQPSPAIDASVDSVLLQEDGLQLHVPEAVRTLQRSAERKADGVAQFLTAQRAAGLTTVGYGAASRAVALLCRAGVTSSLLPGVADASPGKHGRRMPGTDIPVIDPSALISAQPHAVLLFLPDLLNEVRSTIPEIERAGGRWVDVESLPI